MPADDAAVAAAAQAPPFAHAIGGALGSAFALLLFFPLERARIELQSQVSRTSSSSSSSSTSEQQQQHDTNATTTVTHANATRNRNTNTTTTATNTNPTSTTNREEVVSNMALDSVDVQIHILTEGTKQHHHQQQQGMVATTVAVDSLDLVVETSEQNKVNIVQNNDSPSSSSWASSMEQGKKVDEDVAKSRSSRTPPSWSMEESSSSASTSEFSNVEGHPLTSQQQQQQQYLSKEEEEDQTINNRNGSNGGLLPCLLKLHERGTLYQGVTPVITTVATSQFVFFYLNEAIKQLVRQVPTLIVQPPPPSTTTTSSRRQRSSSSVSSSSISSRHHNHPKQGGVSPLLSLVASCLAGIWNVLVTSPLWVCNMAIVTGQTETNSLWKELKVMIQQHGWKYMWNGTSASLLLVSNPVVQFFCYEQLKRIILTQRRQQQQQQKQLLPRQQPPTKLSSPQLPLIGGGMAVASAIILAPYEAFVVGAIAKAIATITTYPLQLAQTILRLKDHHKKYNGTWHCLYQLYVEGGIRKLFTGMRAKLLQTVLTAAFTFLTYEQILGVIQTALIKSRNNNV